MCGRSVDAVPRHGTMVEEGEAVEGEVEITTMRVASAASLATGRELLRDSRVLNSDGRGAPQPPDGPLRTSSCFVRWQFTACEVVCSADEPRSERVRAF